MRLGRGRPIELRFCRGEPPFQGEDWKFLIRLANGSPRSPAQRNLHKHKVAQQFKMEFGGRRLTLHESIAVCIQLMKVLLVLPPLVWKDQRVHAF
jgi:hypothetical protein